MQFFRNRRERGRPAHPDILTPGEWRVLEHIRAGRRNPEIAVRLGVSVNTVRTHVSSMLAKTELRDRAELAAWDGEPVEASRVAPGRFSLAAPFGWLRETLGQPWLGKAVIGGTVAALSVGAIVGLALLQQGGATPPAPTPPPVAGATQEPGPNATPAPAVPSRRSSCRSMRRRAPPCRTARDPCLSRRHHRSRRTMANPSCCTTR